MHAHIVIWTRDLWMGLSCLWSHDLLPKTIARTSLNSYKANLGSVGKPVNLFVEEEVGQYFDLIIRGGLTYPSNMLFNVSQYACVMFNVCISSVEYTYLEVAHQKQIFFGSY